MPNWCENRVDIYCHDPEILKEFVDTFMPNGYFDFHRIAPLDLGTLENGEPKWDYDTAVKKWGTKWQIGDEVADRFEIEEDMIRGWFDTAWAPPEGIYHAIDNWFAEREADYSISWFYDEPGMQFAGYLNNE
jgi:hypothetical protein